MSRYEQQTNKGFSRVLIITVLIVVIAFAIWIFWGGQQAQELQVKTIEIPKARVIEGQNKNNRLSGPESEEAARDLIELIEQENLKQKMLLPALGESDAFFRQALVEVSVNLLNWFEVEGVISKYIVLVNDLAQNQIVFKHRAFLKPATAIMVKEDSQGLYLSKASYSRYDNLANAVMAIDVDKALQLYISFKPLFEQVYTEFSYPEEYQLQDVFLKAAANVIGAPIIENRIALVRHSIRYKFADKKLEQLSDVEKQMIRMGPENTRKIQLTLRKLVQALVVLSE